MHLQLQKSMYFLQHSLFNTHSRIKVFVIAFGQPLVIQICWDNVATTKFLLDVFLHLGIFHWIFAIEYGLDDSIQVGLIKERH